MPKTFEDEFMEAQADMAVSYTHLLFVCLFFYRVRALREWRMVKPLPSFNE